jgi:patatin-like phospholipase/acyl hydrolase
MSSNHVNTKLTRILSIDGGGIRGIIPGQILVTLENKLQQMDNNPDARLADYFDLIAGTSTGGILTCIYLLPDLENPAKARFSAEEAVALYLDRGDEIFDMSFWQKIKSGVGIADEKYDEEPLVQALTEYMDDTMLSNLLRPTLITSYDIENRKGHFFKSHRAKKNEDYDFYVREVARSTSAAPTYFEVSKATSASGKEYGLIDGGVFVNNPALCAYSEARTTIFDQFRDKPKATNMMILSIGTGNEDESYPYRKVKKWGALQWLVPLIDIMMSGVSQTVDYQLKQIYDAVEKPDQYIRISPGLEKANSKMDDVSRENLNALKEAGSINAEKYDEKLTKVAKMLIANK